jgi:hypothetical protein
MAAGRPALQAPLSILVAEFRSEANQPHVVLPGQPDRQFLSAASNEFSQLIQAVVTGQPLGQGFQGGVTPAGHPLAQLVESVGVPQPAGQPQIGHVISGLGKRPDDLDGFLDPAAVS